MGMIIGVALGSAAGVGLCVVAGVLWRKKKQNEHTGVGGVRAGQYLRSDEIQTGIDDENEMTHRINLPGGPTNSPPGAASSGNLQDVPLSSKSDLKGS